MHPRNFFTPQGGRSS
nr:unnamed protein product [Callosobruchus chinensis]